jgi:hypothetical protein
MSGVQDYLDLQARAANAGLVARLESRIRELEAALHEIRDADCRGEVCKGIACVALNVAYPTQDRGGEHG